MVSKKEPDKCLHCFDFNSCQLDSVFVMVIFVTAQLTLVLL